MRGDKDDAKVSINRDTRPASLLRPT